MAKSAIASDIFPHSGGDEPLLHGGDLGAARRLFPGAPEPFLDLSTGINPNPYPVPRLTADVLARLPEPTASEALAAVAAKTYGASSAAHVVAAPGTQILLPFVAGLAPPGRAAILSPTYAEHARAAALAGHRVTLTRQIADLAKADLAIITNPNSPDGRIIAPSILSDLAQELRRRSGMLVIDEAFMDVAPEGLSFVAETVHGNVIVLRSFGKFFGLAGLRLGFALLEPRLALPLSAKLGPWAVSGPALAIGARALADAGWIERTRRRLSKAAERLDAMLTDCGLDVVGGTALFRLVRMPAAAALFDHLGRAGILVRPFPENAAWLRFGLPANEGAWRRLQSALATFPNSR